MPVTVKKEDINLVYPDKVSIKIVYAMQMYLGKDYEVMEELYQNAVFCIAGGIFRSILRCSEVKDIDIYPKSTKDYMAIERILYNNGWEERESSTCVSFKKNNKVIQVMNRHMGTPSQILRQFDFTICMAAWCPNNGIFYFYKHFKRDLDNEELVFNTFAEYPIRSIQRSYKYIDYGFWMKTMDLLAMVFKIWYLNLEDDDVIADQLSFYTENEAEIMAQIQHLRFVCRPTMTDGKKELIKKIGMVEQINNVNEELCATCGKDMKKETFRNRLSIKEYSISGMCQSCQDEVFGKD